MNEKMQGKQSQFRPICAQLISMTSFMAGASFAKHLFPAIGAEGATTLRLTGGSLMLMLLLRPWRARTDIKHMRPVVFYGLAMGGMNLLFYMALGRIPLGIAVALEFVGPLVLTIVSSRTIVDLLWLALASAGLMLLLPLSTDVTIIDPVGAMMALAAGACWAIYILAGKKAGDQHGADAAAIGMAVGAIVVLPIGMIHSGAALLRPEVLGIGIVVAFLSSALPYSLEMFALRHLQVRTYGTLASCEPAIGALAGLLLLHETLTNWELAGMSLIIAAAAGATSTASRDRRDNRPTLLPE